MKRILAGVLLTSTIAGVITVGTSLGGNSSGEKRCGKRGSYICPTKITMDPMHPTVYWSEKKDDGSVEVLAGIPDMVWEVCEGATDIVCNWVRQIEG